MIGFNFSGLQLILNEMEDKKLIKEFKQTYSKNQKSRKKRKIQKIISTFSRFVDDAPVMMT